jgi:two-component system cell cycle response regulator
VLRRHLESEGYSVVEANDGQTAIDLCHQYPPDVILLDIEMPGLNGHQVLAHLKADADLKDIPVVFLTGRTGTEDIVSGLRAGAHDYLKKPFEPAELTARVGAAVRTKDLQDRLRTQSAEFDRMSRTDALTGLYNRRHLHEQLRQLGSSSLRHGHGLAVVMLDIDFFKRVNDSIGHQGGDDVLKEFTRRLLAMKRDEDVAGRWGGEEFLLVLPQTDTAGAMAVAERIRSAVAAEPFDLGDRTLAVTVSGGCATGTGDSTDGLVLRADAALYEAKAAGRNRVVADLHDDAASAQPVRG